MKVRLVGSLLLCGSAIFVYACSTNNPTRPSTSFVAPVTQGPANGTIYNFSQQPVALTIVNSVKTGSGATTYTVEVSTSATFASTVFSREGIEEGTSGTTTVTLPQLAGNTTYFWRWRAKVDSVNGEPTTARSFFIRPNIVFAAPGLREPAGGSTIFAARPTFTVTNATRTGTPDSVFYDFQVSTNSGFTAIIASAAVEEQANQTSWAPTVDLPEGNLFWRARAKDPGFDVNGPFASSVQFERRFGIDINKVVVAWGPSHVATWKETAKLVEAYFVPDDDETLCTIYEDPGWPEALYFGGPSTITTNQWVMVNRGGTWYAGAAAWMRPNQYCKKDYDQAFFKDSLFNAWPFSETVLHTGDIIGVMVTTPARLWPAMSTRDERTNIVLVPWPNGR